MLQREQVSGLVSWMIPFSCVDGPGNRLVVFLQGCNFACKNCHNPHTINRCDSCGDCLPGCPSDALSLVSGNVEWDSLACENCDQCIDICPSDSSPMVQMMTVAQVLNQVLLAAPFLTGITVSGGEATVQLKFVRALFQEIKNRPELKHLSCLIDSNGYLPVSAWKALLPDIDGAMIDLKAMDDQLHIWLTGCSNQRVLDSIRFLDQQHKLAEVRFLAIPEITVQETESIGDFLASLVSSPRIRVNAFSHHGAKGEAGQWRNLTGTEKQNIEQTLQRCISRGQMNPVI